MEEMIENIIRNWLNTTFKNPKAMPNPMIRGLAEEIAKHSWDIYKEKKDEYDLEDINMIAEDRGLELTKEEEQEALRRFQNLDNQIMEDISYILDSIESNREEKEDAKLVQK